MRIKNISQMDDEERGPGVVVVLDAPGGQEIAFVINDSGYSVILDTENEASDHNIEISWEDNMKLCDLQAGPASPPPLRGDEAGPDLEQN